MSPSAGRGRASSYSLASVGETLRAYDKATGKVVAEVPLPRNATAAPMTYMVKGQQYIVVATGGANLTAELIALKVASQEPESSA